MNRAAPASGEPLAVEVLTPVRAVRTRRGREWSEAREEVFRMWALLDNLAGRFRGRATLYIVDPLSPQGLLRLLRHRIRHLPAFVIGGREVVTGWDLEGIADRIESWVSARRPALRGRP